MAFPVHHHESPVIEVRVNFGMYAGREATAAEIDRLGEWLLDEVEQRILERAEHWARLCVAERHAEITDGV